MTQLYNIAAISNKDHKHYTIKVRENATREQLLVEIARMNERSGKGFRYCLGNEGEKV